MNYKDHLKKAGIDPEDIGEPKGFTQEIVNESRAYKNKKATIDFSEKV